MASKADSTKLYSSFDYEVFGKVQGNIVVEISHSCLMCKYFVYISVFLLYIVFYYIVCIERNRVSRDSVLYCLYVNMVV